MTPLQKEVPGGGLGLPGAPAPAAIPGGHPYVVGTAIAAFPATVGAFMALTHAQQSQILKWMTGV